MILIALSIACSTDNRIAEVPVVEDSTPAIEALEVVSSGPSEALAQTDSELTSIELDVVLEPSPEIETIEDIEPAPTFAVAIRTGENLVLIAEWADVSVEDVLAVNEGLDPTDPVFAGQRIELPGGAEEEQGYTAKRQAFTDAKLERYMARRGGLVGVDEHRVRTGDTASALADEIAEIPLWVLAEFNRGQDLDRLSIGQRVNLPVLGDTVEVALEEDIGSMEPSDTP